MDTSSLKLNDFESFKNFLFTEKEQKLLETDKWKKYIANDEDYNPMFIPPIINPHIIEEFQLCHYAYWMCIATFCPWKKMDFYYMKVRPHGSCYACAYTSPLYPSFKCLCDKCPLKNHFATISHGCIPPFIFWKNEHTNRHAKEIATWPWIEPDLSRE